MANENNRRPDTRRQAMEQDRKRIIAAGRTEQNNKKQQERLARQEQKLVEKLAGTSRSLPKKSADAKRSAKKPKESKPKPAKKTGFRPPVIDPKQAVDKVKNGMQVIVGGKKKHLFRGIGLVALVLVVFLVLNAAVPISLGEYLSNTFAGAGKGKGFPVTVSTSDKSRLLSVGNDIALLGDSSLMLYKSNGKLLFERQHGFSDPAAVACTARVMVYNRGGEQVRMENRAKTLFTMEAKGPITTAAMAYNGWFGLVTRGNNYVSEVTVYNHKGKEQYIWHSASRQVMDAALTHNGRYLAVATLHVEGGEAVTGLMLFDTKKGTTLYEQTVKGSTPISLSFKKTTLMALLNDRVVAITKTGEKSEHIFDYGQLVCFDDSQDFGLAVTLTLYQNTNQKRLVMLDRNLKVLGQADVTANVQAVSVKDNSVALLTGKQVLFYNRKGTAKKQVDLQNDARGVLCKGDHAIVLSADRLSDVKK